jgi:hypothetical protein
MLGSVSEARKVMGYSRGSAEILYRNALICRNRGMGLAAVAYMRRLVEDKTNELISVAADYASRLPRCGRSASCRNGL